MRYEHFVSGQNQFYSGRDNSLSYCNHFFSGQDNFCNRLDIFKSGYYHFFSGPDHFVVAWITFKLADTSL